MKTADWATEKRIVDSESKEGVDYHKPLGGRNEDYGPDAETPSVLMDHRGAEPRPTGREPKPTVDPLLLSRRGVVCRRRIDVRECRQHEPQRRG